VSRQPYYRAATTNEAYKEKAIVSRCTAVVAKMGAEMEVIGQRKAKGAGNTKGVTDALLHCAGWTLNVEFKQPGKNLDPDQVEQMVKRLAQQVPTYVIRSELEMVELINACRRRPLKREVHPLWDR